MTQKKSFRIENKNLEYLQNLQEKMQVKSLNEALNLLLFFLRRDENFINTMKENYPLLTIKQINIIDTNKKEIKIFLTENEYEISKKLAKQNGFSSVNKFAKIAFLNYVYDESILTQEVLNEFARTNYSIKRVGMNLNIFVRAIQQNSDAWFIKEDLRQLHDEINTQVNNTSNFIKKQKEIIRIKLNNLTNKEKK